MSSKDQYRESGVDIEKADNLIEWLKDKNSKDDETSPFGKIQAGIGGFASLFRPNFGSMKDPLLVSGTDGVGTKLLLGLENDQLEGLGIDLVAMCINDIYTLGAHPLFFIDYFATGKLDDNQFKSILSGIKKGLKGTGAALIGGETAELPGLYQHGHFDLAGFIVGVVDGEKIPKPESIKAGDTLIALHSNGFHSNGYSLVRKWLKETKNPSNELVQNLLNPTVIYHQVPKAIEALGIEKIHGISNITGGGISGNLVRVMPENVTAQIEKDKLPVPKWMKEFIESHTTDILDVETSFNLGCGMVLSVREDAKNEVLEYFAGENVEASIIGKMIEGSGKPAVTYL